MNIKKGRKFLDIGCGTGHLLKAASQKGLETYGIDISEEGVKIGKKNSPDSKIEVGQGENLPFDSNKFDYVACVGALEHFLDIGKGVREMVRVGKEGAKYCIVVPNKDYFYWRLFGNSGTEQQDINENLHSLKKWENIFIKNGLKVKKIYKDKWLFKNNPVFESFNLWKIFKRMIFKLLFIVLPIKYTYQFVFVLDKKP